MKGDWDGLVLEKQETKIWIELFNFLVGGEEEKEERHLPLILLRLIIWNVWHACIHKQCNK